MPHRWLPLISFMCLLVPQTAYGAEKTCPWVQKVLAARDLDFSTFKGDALPPLPGSPPDYAQVSYKGTLELAVSGKAKEKGCSLTVRRRYDSSTGQELPPAYRCTVSWDAPSAEANADYESIAGKLRSCLPDVAFDDKRTGNASEGNESWSFTGRTDGVTIDLARSDYSAFAALIMGKPLPAEQRLAVELTITNEQPMAAGLNLDIPIMK
jgi:hypothetical protein